MKLSCTHCRKEMETRYYEGVAVQLCMDCKGVFLSERKLAIIEDSHETHDSKDALPRRRHTDIKPCPQCDNAMLKVQHGELRPAFIDFCAHCHGIWLEKGVLPSVHGVYEMIDAEQRQFHLHVA